MFHKIHILPNTLINQIAAGEVIQRPASVVKELVDNAIDAGSEVIRVIIKEAGRQLIQVVDDGIGMDEADARMSFEKHATSKIEQTADLFNIKTLGFRGEALAAIAAISQLEMETCLRGAEIGTYIEIEGSEIKRQEPIAASQGTNISVKNLFYNVPARRNFLKSNSIEIKHIIDEFYRAALARPDIAFLFYQNEIETYNLPSTKLSHRIIHLFGTHYKKQLIPCQEETDLVKITGYIGKPEFAKKSRGEQFFFVNKRFIKNGYLHHAVKSAFKEFIDYDVFPFYVLFIDIDPESVDVNVHPTKMEIKFKEERVMYALLEAVIKKGLATYHAVPSLDFEQNINFNPLKLGQPITSPTFITHAERDYMQFKKDSPITPEVSQNIEQLFQSETSVHTTMASPTTMIPEKESLFPSKNELSFDRDNVPLLQLYQSYILAQVKSGVLLIDQHRAHERILYDKFINNLKNNSGVSQQLLIPYHLKLNLADFTLVQSYKEIMHTLGFVIEIFGQNSIVVLGLPVEVADYTPQQLLEELIEQLKWNKEKRTFPYQENLLRALAKRASIPSGKKLTSLEMNTLVSQLFSSCNMNYAPDGDKIFVMLSYSSLVSLF